MYVFYTHYNPIFLILIFYYYVKFKWIVVILTHVFLKLFLKKELIIFPNNL